MVISPNDQPRRSDARAEPAPLLLRVLGAVDHDEVATVAPNSYLPIWETDPVLPLPPGTVSPSTALARLRRPVTPL